MDEAPHALISEDDGIVTVTLNRPEKLNAVTPQVTDTVSEALQMLAERDELRVMVITGTGRYFTSGADLKARWPEVPPAGAPTYRWRHGYRALHHMYDEIEAIEKPVIVAANGTSLGWGVEVAVSCDFRFSVPDALWGLPETRSMGAIPGSGGVSRLTRLVGTHWAKWIALAGQQVTAADARMIGLVHEIHPAEELMDRVYEFARELMTIHPETLAMAKRIIDLCDPQDREKARHLERLGNAPLVQLGIGKPASSYSGPEFKWE